MTMHSWYGLGFPVDPDRAEGELMKMQVYDEVIVKHMGRWKMLFRMQNEQKQIDSR